jgi:hypothetical protein
MKINKIILTSCLALLLVNLSAPAMGSVRYSVSWNPISDPSVDQVRIYRSLDGVDFEYIAAVSSSNTEYIDPDLQSGIRYYYSLRASNSFGAESGFSSIVSGMSLLETCAEAEKDLCRLGEIRETSETSCEVSWTSATPTYGKVRYWILGSDAIDETEMTQTASTSHTVSLTGLENYRIYLIQAVSKDGSGNMTRSWIEYHTTGSQGSTDVDYVLSEQSLEVPEDGSSQFGVRLSAMPDSPVEAFVAVTSGDEDIAIQSGASLTFTAADWDQYQFVTVSAAEDTDDLNGQAELIVATASGFFVNAATLTVVEKDNDPFTGDEPPVENASQIAIFPVPFIPAEGNLQFQNLPENGNLAIYDLKGRRVWETDWAGQTSLEWNGTNSNSAAAATGRYFIVIRDPGGNIIEKRVILAVR